MASLVLLQIGIYKSLDKFVFNNERKKLFLKNVKLLSQCRYEVSMFFN